MTNLSNISSLAPSFDPTTESIRAIVNGNDVYDNLSSIEIASVDARRLLFLLLIDTHRSPFLHGIHHVTVEGKSRRIEAEQKDFRLSQLSKALHGMLASQGHSLSMNVFLGMCFKTTPELVPHFFRGLQLFDPKPTYRSLASLNFVEGLLREAPLPPPPADAHEIAAEEIIPTCVTKTLLGKAIQSPSALLVSSGLKLIITLTRRAHNCISAWIVNGDGSNISGTSEQLKRSISQTLMSHLPEIPLLFSIPTRFDPFHRTTSNANSLVMLDLCEALQCYARLDPSLMANVKFDWTKLVPTDREFFNAEPLLQHSILETLFDVSRLSQTSFTSKMLPNVLSVLVFTTIPEVDTISRKLALLLMEQELGETTDNTETMQCRKYESSLWIDGISAETIQDLVRMIEESKQQRVQHKIMASQAWANASTGYAMPMPGVSTLLSSSIYRLLGDKDASFSDEVSLLLIQIATKMLLFQADPKPFAAIIVFAANGSVPNDKNIAALYHCAKSILDDDSTANTCIESLTSGVFGAECQLNSIVQMVNADKKNLHTQLDASQYASPVAMRQCLRMMDYSKGRNEELNSLVCKIIIGVVEVRIPSYL